MNQSFYQSAQSLIDELSQALPAESAALKSCEEAYSENFIERCSIADTRTLDAVKRTLKSIKGFSAKTFNKLIGEETIRLKALSRSNGNGYANGQAAAVASPAHAGSAEGKRSMLDPAFGFNDAGNADRIRELYGEDLRYCWDMKSWLVWDGMRWEIADTGQARHMAKQAMAQFLSEAVKSAWREAEKFSKESLDMRRINGALSSLEPELPIKAASLDSNPWLLNCLNGTIDLRTGELLPHERPNLITKIVHYRYDPGSTCPLWTGFLEQIMGGGESASAAATERACVMLEYLQRAFGYSATGSTSEKAVFIPFGSGNNGKSTMLTVVRQILAEYSTLIQVDTLMTRQENNSSQTDLSDLRGARFVQTSETEEGQKLSQGKLKRITQGMGTIKSRRLHENMVEFPETHHLWIDTNRKPEIRDAEDQATFNRLHPIPFNVTVTDIDKQFPAKLMNQATGIFAWIAKGSTLWYREQSLGRPASVEEARSDWQEKSDQILHFLQERTKGKGKIDTSLKCISSAAYASYLSWCDASGERSKSSSKVFKEKLISHGCLYDRDKSGIVIEGFWLSWQTRQAQAPEEELDFSPDPS